jgi:hypothetical protein
MVGQHVHIYSNSQKAWMEDGCIYKVYDDGKIEIRYNEGEAAKTLAQSEIKEAVRTFKESEALNAAGGACDIQRMLVRKPKAGEILKISDSGTDARPMTLTEAQANSHYVVYPCTQLPKTNATAEPDMYEIWPRTKVEDYYAPMHKLPKDVNMKIQTGQQRATRWGDLSCNSRPEAWLTKDQLDAKTREGFHACRRLTDWDIVRQTSSIGAEHIFGR